MPSFITPARFTAATGVLIGLGAAVTSALNVIPHETPIGRALVAVSGVIATTVTTFKFLEGQAGWEQQQAAQVHEVATYARFHVAQPPEVAELPDEEPLVATPEPERLTGHVV